MKNLDDKNFLDTALSTIKSFNVIPSTEEEKKELKHSIANVAF